MAFAARGLERGDLSSVVKQYGQDKVDEARVGADDDESALHRM